MEGRKEKQLVSERWPFYLGMCAARWADGIKEAGPPRKQSNNLNGPLATGWGPPSGPAAHIFGARIDEHRHRRVLDSWLGKSAPLN